jgi:hypothetical protein
MQGCRIDLWVSCSHALSAYSGQGNTVYALEWEVALMRWRVRVSSSEERPGEKGLKYGSRWSILADVRWCSVQACGAFGFVVA